MKYLVYQVGCIECGVSSYPIKVCDTLSEAEEVKANHPSTWDTEGGDGFVDIIDLERVNDTETQMTTKRGDMPAMPVMDEAPEHGQHYGMTIREKMAMAAPGKIPDWFQVRFKKEYKDFESPLTADEERHYQEYTNENFGYPYFDEGAKASTKLHAASGKYDREFSEALYFAWRSYYADALLAELER